jgi:hypothetical protein
METDMYSILKEEICNAGRMASQPQLEELALNK